MNDLFKKHVDDVDMPDTSLKPIEILRTAMAAKQAKQKRDALIFNWVQGLVVFVLLAMVVIHFKTFVWIQVPITVSGILLLFVTWLKGVRKHEH